MAISLLPVENCFSVQENSRVVPDFRFLQTTSADFRLMRMQPSGVLLANHRSGVYSPNPLHLNKCREALIIANTEHVDVLLTPEYSVPLDLIDEIVRNPHLQPLQGTLWCLCCEGVEWEAFLNHIIIWEENAFVSRKTMDELQRSSFIGCLLYIFLSHSGEKLCIVPQFKCQHMREALDVCERAGLSIGNKIVLFGEKSPNRLATIICADAYHEEIRTSRIFFQEGVERKYIILHPQLNNSPRHSEMSELRTNMFNWECGYHTLYITANWATGTTIELEGLQQHRTEIKGPWSSVYRRYISSGQSWYERLQHARESNFQRGLGFAFREKINYKIWYAHKAEHIHISLLRKPFGGGQQISVAHGSVTLLNSYIINDSQDGWRESELFFDNSLPVILLQEATGDYEFPIHASVEERDRFFGLCLGSDKQSVYVMDDTELSGRISYHIDDDSEYDRELKAEKVVKLFHNLKGLSLQKYPSQLKRLKGGYKLGLLDEQTPYNVIAKDNQDDEGLLAIYAERLNEAKTIYEHKKREFGVYMKTKICIFYSTLQGGVDYYPTLNDNITAPERVEQSINYTEGGRSIE
jgi:hypothetical protein